MAKAERILPAKKRALAMHAVMQEIFNNDGQAGR